MTGHSNSVHPPLRWFQSKDRSHSRKSRLRPLSSLSFFPSLRNKQISVRVGFSWIPVVGVSISPLKSKSVCALFSYWRENFWCTFLLWLRPSNPCVCSAINWPEIPSLEQRTMIMNQLSGGLTVVVFLAILSANAVEDFGAKLVKWEDDQPVRTKKKTGLPRAICNSCESEEWMVCVLCWEPFTISIIRLVQMTFLCVKITLFVEREDEQLDIFVHRAFQTNVCIDSWLLCLRKRFNAIFSLTKRN